jgi:hypothetical protein
VGVPLICFITALLITKPIIVKIEEAKGIGLVGEAHFQKYMDDAIKLGKISMSTLLVMLVYIRRVNLTHWKSVNPHRDLFIGALLLASKVWNPHSSWRIPDILIAYIIEYQ